MSSSALLTRETDTLSRVAFSESVEALLHEEAWRNALEVPGVGAISDARQTFNVDYYLRHRVETVHRIRMTARTDALALAAMIDEDYEAARRWADYTAEEMKHDRLFLADLSRHGWNEDRVLSVPPLRGTLALINYLTESIHHIGAISAVAYSIYVEWNSAKFSRQTVERAEQALGGDYVKGAKAHLAIDVKQDHVAEMLDIAYALSTGPQGLATLQKLLREIAALIRASFVELHNITDPATQGA